MAYSAPAVDVRDLTEDYCEFQLSGVDAAFANALRRVMIAEVKKGGVVGGVRNTSAGFFAGAGRPSRKPIRV
jgi:hypothetical protein